MFFLTSPPFNGTMGVVSFNGRMGVVVLLSSDVITALGYTPANDSNVVHRTGNENINGIKNFLQPITGNGYIDDGGQIDILGNVVQVSNDPTTATQELLMNGGNKTSSLPIELRYNFSTLGFHTSLQATTPTATRTILLPNNSGTIALLSDIPAAGVTSFNTRTGAVTLTLSDVTTALGFTPAPATGGTGYVQNQIASAQSAANWFIAGTGKAATNLQAAKGRFGDITVVPVFQLEVIGIGAVGDVVNGSGINTTVNIGNGTTDTVRFVLNQNISGGANLLMQGQQGLGGNGTSPSLYFADSKAAYVAIRGTPTATGAGTTGFLSFLLTPNNGTTALSEAARFNNLNHLLIGITSDNASGALLQVNGTVTANAFKTNGGTNTQVVLGDGTLGTFTPSGSGYTVVAQNKILAQVANAPLFSATLTSDTYRYNLWLKIFAVTGSVAVTLLFTDEDGTPQSLTLTTQAVAGYYPIPTGSFGASPGSFSINAVVTGTATYNLGGTYEKL